ncbi:methylated-DNA--[protein]-cysteine S-methyltransferase [Carnobacterium gallinarum]|uniref:methylated-DNA--[protein]-cysteine S-methyltransferase n=1 Tax=Carnobacterium gallinarum TaxID=2749 RepID=UPI00054E6BB9|nr:methylated-DNA--[protein]-cysteine S-methyltransferase [Carnobacterium gallinarum]
MILDTPVGWLNILEDSKGITNIIFLTKDEAKLIPKTEPLENPFATQLALELADYFAGARQIFSVPLSIQTGTAFQRQVWQALTEIPFGEIKSYSDVALAIDNPKAVRAIGQANRNNPIPIVIPCHRVIGKNGSMTGYSGSSEEGLNKKRYLLNLEQAIS